MGGVTRPIIKLNTTTMPRCTGSTPAANSGLARMGAITRMAVALSRNMPTTSSSSRVIDCGTCSTDSTQPNKAATATMSRMAEGY